MVNNLSLNVAKTQAIIVRPPCLNSYDFTMYPLVLNGSVVPYSTVVKDLGVLFDQNLTFVETLCLGRYLIVSAVCGL